MQNLLIIGAGDAGKLVIAEILENERISGKYKLIGILDDDSGKKDILGFPVLGKIDSAKTVIERELIDEIIIAIPSADQSAVRHIMQSLSNAPVKIRIVPGLYEVIEGDFTYNQIRTIEPSDLLGREEVGFDTDVIAGKYRDKAVFITGAGGSIGSEIFNQLFELPVQKVVAFGHGENSIHSLIIRHARDKRFAYAIGDVRDYSKLLHESKKYRPHFVFHAAAHKHVPLMEDNPDEAVKNNILGTYNTAAASVEAGIKRFVLVSTDKAVNPTSVMGACKRIAERIVLSMNGLQHNTRLTLTRFGNVLGSRGSVIPVFREQIERGGPVTVTSPDITRYFMSIREAARLVIKTASIETGNVFVMDMGKPVKIIDLAKEMIRLSGFSEADIPIVFTGLRPGEKLYEEVLSEMEDLDKTNFEKLFISHHREDLLSRQELDKLIEEFTEASKKYDPMDIKRLIKKYVPEYKGDI